MYDPASSQDHVVMDPITEKEVQVACRSLRNGKAPGYDLVTYEHIKYGSSMLYFHLARLFSGILSTCYVPHSFKVGVIIPLHKGKNKPKNNLRSYRGVTLMPVLNKLLEKILWCRIKPLLSQLGFPHPQQFACRDGYNSTLLSLLYRNPLIIVLNIIIRYSLVFWIVNRLLIVSGGLVCCINFIILE